MSPYVVKRLPDEPAILIEMKAGFNIAEHLATAIQDTIALLDASEGPVYLIYDTLEYPIPSLSDLITATNRTARGAGNLYHHPNVKEIVAVTDRRMFELAIKGLNSEVFGFVKTCAFHSMEEALAYVHASS